MSTSSVHGVYSSSKLIDEAIKESPVRTSELARRLTTLSNVIQTALDFLSAFAAMLGAYQTYRLLELGTRVQYPLREYAFVSLAVAGGFVLLMERYGLYRPGSSLLHIRETEGVLRASFWSVAVLAISGYLVLTFIASRWVLTLCFVFIVGFVLLQRIAYYSTLRRFHALGYGVDRVLIYGCGDSGVDAFRKLVQSPRTGMVPVAFVDDEVATQGRRIYENSYSRRRSLPVVGTGKDLDEILAGLKITRLVLADPAFYGAKSQELSEICARHNVAISFVLPQYRPYQQELSYRDLDGVMIAELNPLRESAVYRVAKRCMDLVLGMVLLVLAFPVMALIALGIWITDGRPALFSQERVGHHGKVFRMLKFRSMHRNAPPYAHTPKDYDDPRVTKFGRLLRRTSLDEVPQLLNVIRGEMSLVGPRPEMPFIVAKYTSAQRERLNAKPGITGLWQISADRAFEIHENIDYDLYYLRNRSLLLDIVILLHTAFFAIRGVGAF